MASHHPKGLSILFFTEMWERFGFYLMQGIFILYMIDTTTGGMGLSFEAAADIYGTYMALIYLTPFIGGLLADRVLGYRRAIILGGALMAIGYLALGLGGTAMFWPSLLVVIIGNGFFKPNISVLVGNLYSEEKYRPYTDSGYNIFYMGINIGAFTCNFVAAYLRNSFGWGYAFAAAGVGMFIGLVWFLWGQRYIRHADVMKPMDPRDMPWQKVIGIVFLPALIFGAIGYFIPGNIFGSDSNDAFLFATIPVLIYYFSLWKKSSVEERNPIGALLVIFVVAIFFWAVYFQNGSALTNWAERYTDREIPPSMVGVSSMLGAVQQVDASPREVPKLDQHGRPVTDAAGHVVTVEGPDPYFNNLPRDQWPNPGKSLKLVSTEIFNSLNPFWVVLFTPLIVGVFGAMRRRGKEPSTAAKVGIGLFVLALTCLIMVGAVYASHNGTIKASAVWLIVTYLSITIGELCVSPMGLSLVSKLSPPRFTALMMGGWFLTLSIGNKISAAMAGLWDSYDWKQGFFLINFAVVGFGALVIFVLLRWLNKVLREHGAA